MNCIIKPFQELSVNELHHIYQLRVSVFVVEQNCPYQEIDEQDPTAYHLYLEEGGEILAYLRLLPNHGNFEKTSIGRVIATKRRQGYASLLLKKAMDFASESLRATSFYLEAQTYALGLYEQAGFIQISDVFLEDGIPHVKMEYHL